MYERFTDNARRVMQLANQEAQRFNYDHIDTHHILIGLVLIPSEITNHVFVAFDINVRKIRLAAEKIVQPRSDMVVLEKLPQTPRANKVIEYAIEEVRGMNINYVDTEHLLLGLLREQESVAAQCLMNCGLKLEDIREKILELSGVAPAKKPALEWERNPILPSPIQQMKDAADLSDMPNAEFVELFKRLIDVFKNLRLVTPAVSYGEYLDSLKQIPTEIPAVTLELVNDRDPLGKKPISVVDPSWENGEDSMR